MQRYDILVVIGKVKNKGMEVISNQFLIMKY